MRRLLSIFASLCLVPCLPAPNPVQMASLVATPGVPGSEAPPPEEPTVDIKNNCGGNSFLDGNGATWRADANFTGGTAAFPSGTGIVGSAADELGDYLFQTNRYGTFSYAETVPNGDYRLDLIWAEIYPPWNLPGEREVSFAVEGVTVITNLDVVGTVGQFTSLRMTLDVTVADGQFNLASLDLGVDIPFLSGWWLRNATEEEEGEPPPAIADLAATAGNAEYTVTFTKPATATSVNLYWDTVASVTTGDTEIAGVISGQTIASANGVTKYLRVEAENADGVSALSNEVSVTPDSPAPSGLEYFWGPGGSDGANGLTFGTRFASLEKARDAVRIATGRTVAGGAPPVGWTGATIWCTDGTTYRTAVFQLDSRDSGTAEFPVIYQAVNSGDAIVSGAKLITASNWNPVDSGSDGYGQMGAERDDMYQVDLDTVTGLDASSNHPYGNTWLADYAMLIVGDQLRYMSRYPAGDETTSNAWTSILGVTGAASWGATGTITIAGTTVGNWNESLQDIFFYGPIGEAWEVRWQRATALATSGTNTVINFARYGSYTPLVDGTGGKRTFIAMRNQLNVVGKGEVVFRRPTNFMTYRPTDAEAAAWADDGTRPVTAVTHLQTILTNGTLSAAEVSSNFANHIQFVGLVFEGARDRAIKLYGSTGITFTNCEIRNNGWCGLDAEDQTDFTFDGGGIRDSVIAAFIHGGNKATLTDGNLVLKNCTISEIANNEQANIQQAVRFTNSTKTKLACGILVDNVDFDRCRDVAVAVGNNAIIRNCTFDEILMIVGDRGAIETTALNEPNGSYTMGDVLVEDNTFTNILQHVRHVNNSHAYVSGIYPESVAYWTIQDNQFTNCTLGINMPAGKANIVRRNMFTNSSQGHHDAAILFGDRINFVSNNTALAHELAYFNVQAEPYLSAFPRLNAFRGAYSVAVEADNNVFTASEIHGLYNGELVIAFSGYGSGATGLVKGTNYYIRDRTTTTFRLAATEGGAAIDITADGTALRIGLPENRVITYQDDYTVVDNWADTSRLFKITPGSTWATVGGFQVGIDPSSLNYSYGASLVSSGGLPAEGGGDTALSSLD